MSILNGWPLNTSLSLDPLMHNCKGKNVIIVQDPNYAGGEAARVTGPDQEIFRFPQQGYAPIDSFSGTMLVDLIYNTDYDGNALVLEFWRRNPFTGKESHDPDQDILTTAPGYNITGTVVSFDHRYEYKFIIKTSYEFNGTYADVDVLRFTKNDKNAFIAWSGFNADPWAALQNWRHYGEVTVPYKTGAVGEVDITFNPPFVAIPHITLTMYDGYSDNTTVLMPTYKNVTETGFTIRVYNPNGTAWAGATSVMWSAEGPILPKHV